MKRDAEAEGGGGGDGRIEGEGEMRHGSTWVKGSGRKVEMDNTHSTQTKIGLVSSIAK